MPQTRAPPGGTRPVQQVVTQLTSAPAENADATQARARTLAAAREYFAATHGLRPFVPGRTYIPVTAKTLDAEDLCALVDASLDLWLTTGRFADQFEAALARRLGRRGSALLVNSGSSANLVAVSSLGAPMLADHNLKPIEKGAEVITVAAGFPTTVNPIDRKSTRLNSSHSQISYAVFCLKKKKIASSIWCTCRLNVRSRYMCEASGDNTGSPSSIT